MAHHFARDVASWKRSHAEGGGVLRFFGVHLLALLARHGYRAVERSTVAGQDAGEPEQWHAVFFGPGVPDCHVEIDSRSSTSCFSIAVTSAASGEMPLVDLRDPFELEGAVATPQADRRIGRSSSL